MFSNLTKKIKNFGMKTYAWVFIYDRLSLPSSFLSLFVPISLHMLVHLTPPQIYDIKKLPIYQPFKFDQQYHLPNQDNISTNSLIEPYISHNYHLDYHRKWWFSRTTRRPKRVLLSPPLFFFTSICNNCPLICTYYYYNTKVLLSLSK